MNKQALISFSAGVVVMGTIASLTISKMDEEVKILRKSANRVIDFAHILLNVIEDHHPEIMFDDRIRTFLDNDKFEEITQTMLPELENLA